MRDGRGEIAPTSAPERELAEINDRLKILLIDDDEVDRTMARRALTSAGLGEEFVEAGDAKTGIALLKAQPFDVALLDHALPDMDGMSALRAIRAAGIDTPIIMLTGQGDERLAVDMVRAGANDYLSKNRLSRDLLSHSVRHAVRLHRAQAEAQESERKAQAAFQAQDQAVALLDTL